MSHVAVQECKAGDPMFADLEALRMAADMLGGELVTQSTYHWYERHVGDYPVPKGMKASELGKNAEYVVKIKPSEYEKFGVSEPYEMGLVNDPNNPGAYVPIYDFWAGGHGLNKLIGDPLMAGGAVKMLAPKLKQMYDMCCDKIAAAQAGDNIQFYTLADAKAEFPQLFQGPVAAEDKDTWVSIADTEGRVKAG